MTQSKPVRLGVIGLGRAFTLMLPTLTRHPLVQLVAASDPRPDARAQFSNNFGGATYGDPAVLCADPNVDAVYVASPHQFHHEHVAMAARCGKHVLVEKPMALTIADCLSMIQAAQENNVHLLVGHSHSYNLPYLRTRELIASGRYGRVRMINGLNFTDFMYRPRRPEELDTAAGGGVVFSQAAHQIDVVRLLMGSPATSVRAFTGMWDPARPSEGAYNAQLSFQSGAFASVTYSGYGHFDTDEFTNWRGELGQLRSGNDYGRARRMLLGLHTAAEEIELKNRRAYGLAGSDAFEAPTEPSHNHFGFLIVSCEEADLRPMPDGIIVYGNEECRKVELPMVTVPRAEVIEELHAAVVLNRLPLHSGEWGLATLEICLAILASSRDGRSMDLVHQV